MFVFLRYKKLLTNGKIIICEMSDVKELLKQQCLQEIRF